MDNASNSGSSSQSTVENRETTFPPVRLVKVRKLEQQIRERRYQPDSSPVRFREYKVSEETPLTGLRDFVGIYQNKSSHEFDYFRYVWLGDALVRLQRSSNLEDILKTQLPAQFGLRLSGRDFFPTSVLCVHSASEVDAVECIKFLLKLADSGCSSIRIRKGSWPSTNFRQETTEFPIEEDAIGQILQNENRELAFENFEFSHEQCRAFLNCPQKCRLAFHYCRMSPEGIGISRGEQVGPVKLNIRARGEPVDSWIYYLQRSRISSLELMSGEISQQDACQALATAPLESLRLERINMVDNGSALISSISQGNGPRSFSIRAINQMGRQSLGLGLKPFNTLLQWQSFLSALHGNNRIEVLTLRGIDLRRDEWMLFSNALKGNQGLMSLSLSHVMIDGTSWQQILLSISQHPRIYQLDFRSFNRAAPNSPTEMRDRTERLIELLDANRNIDTVSNCSDIYDNELWGRVVFPMLKRNLYRKRFEKIHKMGCMESRTALIGAFLGAVRLDPSLIWMLLSMNQDVIAERLLAKKQGPEASMEDAAFSRKRNFSCTGHS